GGTATIQADGGAITVGGLTSLIADAGSGRPVEGNSGDAFGGSANIQATDGGTVTLADTSLSAIGTGDDNFGNGDGIAGDGNGGDVNIFADTAGSITVNGNLTANASGAGGNMLDGSTAGGQGIGGNIHMSVVDGSIGVTGMTTMTARGEGGGWIGEGNPSTAQGGLGQGGFIDIFGNGPGSISLNGIGLDSTGTGGDGQTGGDGRGGNAGVRAVDGTIDLGPTIGITAIGTGGNATVGFGGFGGFGQGGTAYIEALADPGNIEVPATHGTITGGSANLDVSGFGGTGGAGNGDNILPGSGGNGQGGFHQGEEGTGGAFAAAAEPGGSLTLGDTTLVSNGQGGAGGAGGVGQAGGFGGDGSGGSTQAGNYDPDETGGTTATATYGNLTMIADGTGGFGGTGGENAPQGDGGAGFGGADFVNAKGTVNAASIFMSAEGFGGAGTNGGFGQGGTGILQSFAGSSFNVDSDAQMDVSGWGGEGSGGTGGAGTGGNSGEGGATGGISALDGSTIDVGGTLSVAADGHGAGGSTGGEGSGGAAYLEALGDGSITAGAIMLSAQASGGGGIDLGGDAFGGAATLFIDGGSVEATGSADVFQNDELVASGSILLFSDAAGGTGVQGGIGSGGVSEILTSENGGSLTAANATFLFARGVGGDGDDSAEGDGGAGGDGDGGTVSIDVSRLSDTSISLADLTLNADGTGGAGGNGGGLEGIGGAGGIGGGGRTEFDIAGGTFEAGAIEDFARGNGGNGGSGANGTAGSIGFGGGGSITAIASDGSISADSLSADAFGSSDGGSIQLASRTLGGPQPGSLQFGTLQAFADGGIQGGEVQLIADAGTTSNVGDAQLGASGAEGIVSVSAGAPDGGPGTLLADNLTLTGDEIGLSTFSGGNVTVSGTLQANANDLVTFSDDGNLGLVSADILNVNAFGIAFDGTSLGTNIDGTTSVDFETIGNLDVGDGFVTGSLTLHSDATLTTGNLSSGGNMAMSGASIGAGTLDSGGNMTLDSSGALTTLDLTAVGEIDLDSTGDMQFGNVDADTLELSSGGAVIGGNIIADTRAGGDADGAITLGDINVGPNVPDNGDFSVSFGSGTSISVGNVSGADKVGFATPGTLTAGDISAGSLFMALVTGDMHIASITTASDGQVYVADSSMFTDAGGPDDFDVSAVLAADPVATQGSITIDGPVSTGTLRAAAGTDFDSGAILASGNVTASAGGTLSVDSADIGGDLSLTAGDNIDSGDLSADGSLTLSAATDLGAGKLSAGASLSLTTGGNLSAGAIDSAEDLLLTAGGTLTTLDLTAVGEIELNSTGDMQFGNVDADSLHLSGGAAVNGGNIIADTRASGDAEGAIKLGDINVGPNIPQNGDFSVSFSSGTSIQVGNVSGADKVGFATPGTFTAGNISGGSLILALVTGDIHVGSLTTNSNGQVYMADYSMFTDAGGPDDFDPAPVLASDPVATAGSITIADLVSTGAFRAAAGTDFGSATIQAGDGVSISAGGNLSVGDSSAGGDFTLTAGGEIAAGDVGADGLLSLSAGTDLNAGNLSSGGNLELDAGGNITTLDLTSREAVAASATGDLKVGKVISGFTPGIAEDAVEATGQDVRLEAENGNLTTDAVQSAGGIFLDAGQNVVATDLTAVDAVQVTAGGDSSVNDVNASGATFDAGGTANFFGTVAAPTIGVTSSDINIAEGASLGVSGLTTLITLGAVSDNPVILGGPEGASTPGQYTLSEAGDINADSVVLVAQGASEGVDPDVIIQDAQIEGSQTEGGGVGSVEVDTGGSIRVEGFVDYIDAAASDTLTLNAGSGIQVIAGTGGISITDGAGNLSGTLSLIAPDVWVADQSVLDQLAEDPNYANRDSDLATNPGADNQDGNLRAGAIHGEVSGSFLVQNSGTADNPAGISVGEGDLTIVNSGESPALAIVNGHQIGPGGQIVGGNDFLPTVGFEGDAGFAAASTVNGCSIISGCALPPPPPPPPPAPAFQFGAESILGPIGLMTNAENEGDQGDTGDGTEGDNNGNDELDILLFGLNSGQNAFDPLVDDPVTSGNDAITSGGPQ
ncbi:MAG TPA: hypothetical protein VFG41_02455, partial [Sphingomicrobium sp.]|nr:hypothetical protein [Sphingomicrobium sp.]